MSDNRITNQIQAGGNVKVDNSHRFKIINKVGSMKVIVISVVVVAILIGAVICFSQSSNKIVGRWLMLGTDNIYEFTKDGQFLYLSGGNDGATVTYSVEGKQLQLDIDVLWAHATVLADIKISNDKLILSNFIDPDDIFGVDEEDEWIFTRVK